VNVLLMEVNPYVPVSLPISLGYLAAGLAAEGHRVEIRNVGEATPLSPAGLQAMVRELAPALVGFATYQRNMLHVRGLARAVKAVDPAIRVILGGPQATFMPSQAMAALPEVDFICRGEGEIVLPEVVRALESDRPGGPVAGTTTRLAPDYWEDGPAVQPPEDLDIYPSPFLREALDLQGFEEAILLTSRGCPYGCVFCYTPRAFGRGIRYHSVDRVVEDMRWLNGKGIRRFWLADPSFSFARERTEALLQGMIRRGVAGGVWLETRADLVDSDLLALMAAAGVRLVAFGLESASEKVLAGLGKGVSPAQVRSAVELAHRHGLDVELFSQYGLPGEGYADALETLAFVRDLVPIRGNSNAQQTRLYFGTRLHDRFRSHGIRPLDGARLPYMAIGSRYETDWMTVGEIHRVRDLWKAASLDGGKRMVS
jgi:radical SAM superfamily enzyme YgiQ (UPF0313 family)